MIIAAGLPSMEVAEAPPSDGETAKTPAPAPAPTELSEPPADGKRRPAGRRPARRDTDGSAPATNPHGGYHCSYCGKYFSSRSNMVVHERTHTHERPYTCSHCGRTFSQHGQMVIHVRSHTGQRPFKCTHCDKAFTSSKVLKIHVRTHTGEKPYACEHCDKRFAAYANLVVHRRIHTKVRPYNCRHCKRTFEHSGNLQRHVRAHGIANGEEDAEGPCSGATEQCRATAAAEAAAAAAAAGLRCRLCQAAYSGPASLLEHRCPRLMRRPRKGVPQEPADTQPLSFIELFDYIEQLRQQAQDPTAAPGPLPYQVKAPPAQWQLHQQQHVDGQPPPDQHLQLPGQYPETQPQRTPDREGQELELPAAAVEHGRLQPLQPSPEQPCSPPHTQQEQDQEQYRLHVLQPRPRLAQPQTTAAERERERAHEEKLQQPERKQQGPPQSEPQPQLSPDQPRVVLPSEGERHLHLQYYQHHHVQSQHYLQYVQHQQPAAEQQYRPPILPLPPGPSFQPPPDRQEGFLPPGNRSRPATASLSSQPSSGEATPPTSGSVTPQRSEASVGTSPTPPSPPSRTPPPAAARTPPPPPPPLQRSFSTQTEPCSSPPAERPASSGGRLSVDLRPPTGASSPSQRRPPSQGRQISDEERPAFRESAPTLSEGRPSGELSSPERRTAGGRNRIWEELLTGERPVPHEHLTSQQRSVPHVPPASQKQSPSCLGHTSSGEDPISTERYPYSASGPILSTPASTIISSALLTARDRLRSAVHRHPLPDPTSSGGVTLHQRAALLPPSVHPASLPEQLRYRVSPAAQTYCPEPAISGAFTTYGYGIPQRLINGISASSYGGASITEGRPMPRDELVITVKPARSVPTPVAGSTAAGQQVTSPGVRSAGPARVTVLEPADVTVSGPTRRLSRKTAGRAGSPRVRSWPPVTATSAAAPVPAPAPTPAPSPVLVPGTAPTPDLAPAPAPAPSPAPAATSHQSVVAAPASNAAPQLSLHSPPTKRRRACPGLVPLSPPPTLTAGGRRASVGAPPAAVQVTGDQWSPAWGAVPGRRAPNTR